MHAAIVERSVLYMSVRSSQFIMLSPLFLTHLLSGCSVHYCEWDIDGSNYYCRTIYFSLQFCQFLLHKFSAIISSSVLSPPFALFSPFRIPTTLFNEGPQFF